LALDLELGRVTASTDSRATRTKGATPQIRDFSVGTRFLKVFPGEGTFQGTITAFDGEHYTVYYPSDGDDEDLSDNELDELKIIDTPSSRAVRRTLLATKRR
jgi:hypothetical protein